MGPTQPDYNQQSQYQPQQPIMADDIKKRHSLPLIIALVVLIILFLVTAIFGFMSNSQLSDLKKNFDSKVEEASSKAVKEAEVKKDADFAEREKSPYEEYQGPAAYGSVKIKYPKTWSAFVTESTQGGNPVDGYFHPGFVPGIQSGTAFALHLQVIQGDYATQLKQYDSLSKSGKVKVTPITINNVAGARVDGEFVKDKKGSIVLFPLRDKTLKLTTESEKFTNDFNDIILKNLTFSP